MPMYYLYCSNQQLFFKFLFNVGSLHEFIKNDNICNHNWTNLHIKYMFLKKNQFMLKNESIQIVWPLARKHGKKKHLKKSQFPYYEKITNWIKF
jgi:hypothetical protein